MSFAFMPLYSGDYLRDTRHLTPSRHGVYLLLLMYCWDQKGPVPLDEQECAGIANCRSADEIEALRYILQRYFVRMEDGWYNPRMQREVERSENVSKARSDAGKKGYEARSKQLPSKCQAIAKQVHLPPPPPPSLSPPPKNITSGFQPDIVLPAGFERFWSAYPKTSRKVAKAKCLDVWKRRGLEESAGEIVRHVELMSQTSQWRGGYEPAPLTYLNQKRYEDDIPVDAPAKTEREHMQAWQQGIRNLGRKDEGVIDV